MKKPSNQGFSIIELMVTLTVAAILLGVAIPSFTNVMDSNRAAVSSNELLTALAITRNEAVKRGRATSICPANPAMTACANSTNWATGWIAFVDDGATVGTIDGGETVVQTWPPARLTVTNTVNFVRYIRDGSRDGTTEPRITLSKSSTHRCVIVSKPGRANLTKVVCS